MRKNITEKIIYLSTRKDILKAIVDNNSCLDLIYYLLLTIKKVFIGYVLLLECKSMLKKRYNFLQCYSSVFDAGGMR